MSKMTTDIYREGVEVLKQKSSNFINKNFLPPSKKIMRKWLKKKWSKKHWSKIESTTTNFRKSLPIVSHQMSDNKKSTKGKKALGRTFAAPSWVSADLGKKYSTSFSFKKCRFFSLTWEKLWELFYCCTNYIRSSIPQ